MGFHFTAYPYVGNTGISTPRPQADLLERPPTPQMILSEAVEPAELL